MTRDQDLVIGAGPAGLTAAYELGKLGRRALVLEASGACGGLSRTCDYKGYRFDIGGHRFFTKVAEVNQLWKEILGDELLVRPRLSRILYAGHLFDYPLKPLNALAGLGPIEALRVAFSYAHARLRPSHAEDNFEQWVVNRFGRRLFEIFFKTYTEKVWGMSCTEISAEWASQRIQNLSLLGALRNALFRTRSKDGVIIKTLIDEFMYPRHGPGQMWTRCADLIREQGGEVRMHANVVALRHDGRRVTSLVVEAPGAERHELSAAHVLSSMPVQTLIRRLDPAPPAAVREAAGRLRYRDFLTVALIVDAPDLFPDNWIYIHSPDVFVGRIQNFKNWSPSMVPDPSRTALGLEYFVNEGDDLWSRPDADLLALARDECDRLGLASATSVLDGHVLRVKKAYPVYDDAYREALATIREWLDGLGNLQLIGRNGQHRYNNQDHSMVTGLLAARNLAGARHDIWQVNVEHAYHEDGGSNGAVDGRLVPRRLSRATSLSSP